MALCLVGSATVDRACPNEITHISGTCGEHAPRVCSRHPWDDGRDGFCGECLDEYQQGGDFTPALTLYGPRRSFTLVGLPFQRIGDAVVRSYAS